MARYLITRVGAQHRTKKSGSWVTLGKGDSIELSQEQYNSGNYSHLGLHHMGAESSSTATNVETGQNDQSQQSDQTQQTDNKTEVLAALTKLVEESTTQPQLDAARAKMVESGLFGDKVEGKKADLLKMLADRAQPQE